MKSDVGYTLILTKGTHLISHESADRIKCAIERDDPLVDILLDPFGDVDSERVTSIAVRHVVAVTKNSAQVMTGAMSNVTVFRQKRETR